MASCLTPWAKNDTDAGAVYMLPCGRCPACTARRASGWSFRLMQEEKISTSAHFITLTYDTSNVPITKNRFMSLSKRDVQLFFKRLRSINPAKLKYYVVGEYGGKTNRPHYHAIIFNAKLETYQPAWQNGEVHYGTVTGASIGYTLKYISKPGRIPLHKNDDRVPEFSLMSKGLGKNYLTPNMIKWHKNDLENRMYINLDDGKKAGMPRYYKDKIYSEDERLKIQSAAILTMGEQIQKFYDPLTYEQNHREREAGILAAFNAAGINSSKNDKL